MRCNSCNHIIPDYSLFCPICGARQGSARYCLNPDCLARIEDRSYKYCPQCGRDLDTGEERIEMQTMKPCKVGELFGYKSDHDGCFYIPPMFSSAAHFSSKGIAIAGKNGSKGIINKLGNIVLPFKFQEITTLDGDRYLANGINGFCIFNHKGEKLCSYYDQMTRRWDGEHGWLVMQNGKYGLLSNDLQTIMECRYDSLVFSCGLILTSLNGLQGLSDMNGKTIVANEYLNVSHNSQDYWNVKDRQGRWGLFTSTGRIVLPCEFESIRVIRGSLLIVSKGNSVGLYSDAGHELIPCQYDQITGHVDDDELTVTISEDKGIYSNAGKEIVPCKYESVYKEDGVYMVSNKDGKYGVLDLSGKVIIDCAYRKIEKIGTGFIAAPFGSASQVIIDSSGAKIRTFSAIERIPGTGYLIGQSNAGCEVYSLTYGSLIPPGCYDTISFLERHKEIIIFITTKNCKYGAIGIEKWREAVEYFPCIFDRFGKEPSTPQPKEPEFILKRTYKL